MRHSVAMESWLGDKTRELVRDGVSWKVRETDTSHSPGSRGDRCLIFDAEGIVRRAWDVPSDWSDLGDNELWALLDREAHPAPAVRDRRSEHASSRDGQQRRDAAAAAVATATVAAAHARSLLIEIRLMLEANQALRAEQQAMLDEARRVRQNMQMSIQAYAEGLRREGVSPERALVLLKEAMRAGLRGQDESEEHLGDGVVADGIAWGIAAYYAA